MQNRLVNLSLPSNTKLCLSKMEQAIMEDIEDNWIKPPLPYPLWAYDRQEETLYIYDMKRYNQVLKKYYESKGVVL